MVRRREAPSRTMKAELQQRGLHPSRRAFRAPQDEEKLCSAHPDMRTDLFDFDLPPERIALRPASPRDSAKMLVVENGALRDQTIADLPQWLKSGDQLVVNDTKVIAAQLKGRRIGRETEPKIEATLIKRLDGSRW